MARMAILLGGTFLLIGTGCTDEQPEQDEDYGKPFPTINRDNYRVFPKNPQLVDSPGGPATPGAPLALESQLGCGQAADVSDAQSAAMTVAHTKDLPLPCDANLIAEQCRRFLIEGRPGGTDFSVRIGGAIILDVGAGWACPYGHPQGCPRGRVAIKAASGSVAGKIEVGAGR